MRRALTPLVPLVAMALGLAAVGPAGSAEGPSGPSGSAQARPTHHRIADPTRDVYRLLENPDGDLTSVVVRHRRTAVNVTVRLAKLRRPALFTYTMVSLRTAQDTWNTTLYASASHPAPEIYFDDSSGSGAACPAARARIDYAADVIRVRVPRRCLGNPAWVRPSVAVINPQRSPAGTLLIDVAPGKKPREQQQFGARVWHAGR
jgi:hypothetical protein